MSGGGATEGFSSTAATTSSSHSFFVVVVVLLLISSSKGGDFNKPEKATEKLNTAFVDLLTIINVEEQYFHFLKQQLLRINKGGKIQQ